VRWTGQLIASNTIRRYGNKGQRRQKAQVIGLMLGSRVQPGLIGQEQQRTDSKGLNVFKCKDVVDVKETQQVILVWHFFLFVSKCKSQGCWWCTGYTPTQQPAGLVFL
jgi:hypothetical protein